MIFEWDDEKDESNYSKHRVRFDEAISLWSDAFAIEFYDEFHSDHESRFIRIGTSFKNRILTAVYLVGESVDVVRIISSRKSTLSEVRKYENRI